MLEEILIILEEFVMTFIPETNVENEIYDKAKAIVDKHYLNKKQIPCKTCNGTGKILIKGVMVWDHEDNPNDHYIDCPDCKSISKTNKCDNCHRLGSEYCAQI